MCGAICPDEIQDLYDLPDGPPRSLPAHYNIAPTAPVEVARLDADGASENGEAVTEFLKPAGEERLRMWPVSRRVNKTGTGDDDPSLLDKVVA
jgi:hypothetical protein